MAFVSGIHTPIHQVSCLAVVAVAFSSSWHYMAAAAAAAATLGAGPELNTKTQWLLSGAERAASIRPASTVRPVKYYFAS